MDYTQRFFKSRSFSGIKGVFGHLTGFCQNNELSCSGVIGAPNNYRDRRAVKSCLLEIDGCTLEEALFPYLFPFNKGAWRGGMQICNYLKMRLSQLFSPFTLCNNYLLMMFHVRQAHILVSNCAEGVLQRDMAKLSAADPKRYRSRGRKACHEALCAR